MSEEQTPRRRRRRLLIVLLLIAVPVILVLLAGRRPTIQPGTVLTVTLEGDIAEGPPSDPLRQLAQALGGAEGTPSLHELRRALHAARTDPRVAGVVVELRGLRCGWAVVEELRDLLTSVREAGKPVQALLSGDMAEEKEYAVAAATGRVLLAPEGGLLLNGLFAEVTFYRGLLDWLKVEPEVIMFKEYKSAGEPFVNTKMSPAMRESLESLLSDIHGRFLERVAASRKIDPDRLRQLLDRGLLTPKEGQDAGLIDGVGYRDEVEEALGGTQKGKRASVARYLKALGDEPQTGSVALLYASGPIIAGSGSGGLGGGEVIEGPRLARQLREAADDDQIKAIVLRVDSPGGSAVGSDVVWREIKRAREVKKKPVVVSMSTVAGSGGYWISMGADAIVAQPSTLTGSIGVVFTHFNVLPLWERTGGTIDTIKLGANADIMSIWKKWTPEQTARITAWMQQVYDDFVGRAAAGRKMTPEALEPLAHGRVWTGSQAKERKLVDELGGLDVALRIARERAKVPAGEPVLFPRQRGLLGLLSNMKAAAPRLGALLAGSDAIVPDPRALLRQAERELGAPGPALLAPEIDIR